MTNLGTGYTGEGMLEEYISTHIEAEGELLNALYRETNIRLLNPRMASGHIQGRLLKMLTRMIFPEKVLEIGTFAGYSALCIAEGLPEGGVVHTIEVDDELEEFILKWVGRSPYSGRIVCHTGDALKIVPQLGLVFDMAFIDGEKREYPQYYDLVFGLVRSGGFIIADNTLWDGHVVEQEYDRDAQTQAIRRFNDIVAADSRVEVAMIPIRDGITIIRKK